MLALRDLELGDAASTVLGYKFRNRLSKGQIQDMSHDLATQRLWEEYQDIGIQKSLYDCTLLFNKANLLKFPRTDAMQCELEVLVENEPARCAFQKIDKALIIRILADSMGDNAVLRRLFDDQLKQGPFTESEDIAWSFRQVVGDTGTRLTVISSCYWLKPLNEISEYTSYAYQHYTIETF